MQYGPPELAATSLLHAAAAGKRGRDYAAAPEEFPLQFFRPILPFLMLLLVAARIILLLRGAHASSIHDWRIAALPPLSFTYGELQWRHAGSE
jgi:hypothetical protein